MFYTLRRAFGALLAGLLLAGCSGNGRGELRPAPEVATSARATDQETARSIDRRVSSHGSTRPAEHSDKLLGYVAPSDPRYDITLDQIRERVRNSDAAIIDARGPVDFALGHVRGAFNMPAGQKEAYMLKFSQNVAPGEFIIIYCNGPHCDSGDMVYEYLAPQGYSNMRVFKPGWAAIASAKDLR